VNNTSALSWRDHLLPAWWGRLPRNDGQDVVLDIGRCTAAVPLHTTNMVIWLLWASSAHVGESVLIHDLGTNRISNRMGKLPCGTVLESGARLSIIHHVT